MKQHGKHIDSGYVGIVSTTSFCVSQGGYEAYLVFVQG